MKKIFILFFFIFAAGFWAAGDENEIDFLLFQPNLSNLFVNGERASIQLDNLAKEISGKNIANGQILVYGYAANAQNNIDPIKLSRERAVFVINELRKRGIATELFSDPVGHGSVDTWGNNLSETDREPNRRVRILLAGVPVLVTPEPEIQQAASDIIIEETVTQEISQKPGRSQCNFPWRLILLILLLALIVFLLIKFGPAIFSAIASRVPLLQKNIPEFKSAGGRRPTNIKYVGQTFGDVPYEYRIVKDRNGRWAKWGGPIFNKVSLFNVKLPKKLYKAGRDAHFTEAERQLQNFVLKNPAKAAKTFSPDQIEYIRNIPHGKRLNVGNIHLYIHHAPEAGRLQFVDIELHDYHRHTGGIEIWGGG